MLARTWADLTAGLNPCVLHSWGIPARRVRRYNATGSAPRHVIDRLLAYRYGEPVSAPGWAGFTFREGELWTPEDVRVTAAEVRSLPYLQALNRELQRKLAQPQQWTLKL